MSRKCVLDRVKTEYACDVTLIIGVWIIAWIVVWASAEKHRFWALFPVNDRLKSIFSRCRAGYCAGIKREKAGVLPFVDRLVRGGLSLY
jgi:hypothetical protein